MCQSVPGKKSAIIKIKSEKINKSKKDLFFDTITTPYFIFKGSIPSCKQKQYYIFSRFSIILIWTLFRIGIATRNTQKLKSYILNASVRGFPTKIFIAAIKNQMNNIRENRKREPNFVLLPVSFCSVSSSSSSISNIATVTTIPPNRMIGPYWIYHGIPVKKSVIINPYNK